MSDAYKKALAYANEDAAASASTLPDSEGEFSKGVRAGTYGMGSSLRNAVGAVGDAVGANEFAQGQYQEADRLSQRAAETGPRVTSYKDVGSLRDAADYGMGVLGGVLPSAAIGVATGTLAATPIRALAGATAAYTPMEMGDTVAKMRSENPGQPLTGEDTLRAFGTGVASAGLQSVVPAMVGGQVAGRGAAGAANRTFKQTVARNAADIPLEGALEAGGEAVKQTGAGMALDTDSLMEAGVAGMVGGAGMGAVGTVADSLYAAPQKGFQGVKDTVLGGVKTAQEAFSGPQAAVGGAWTEIQPQIASGMAAMEAGAKGAWDAMPDSVKGVGEFLKTSFEDQIDTAAAARKRIMEADDVPAEIKQAVADSKLGMAAQRAYVWAVDRTRSAQQKVQPAAESAVGKVRGLLTPKDDTEDRILNGKLMGDEDITAATPEAAEGMLNRSTKAATDWMSKRATELMDRADISQEKRAEIGELVKNASDAGSQAAFATISKSIKLRDGFMSRWDALTAKLKEGTDKGKTDSKKSEDFSGYDQQIVERIAPILERTHPYLMDSDDPKTLRGIGATLRLFISAASEGKMDVIRKTNSLLEASLGKEAAGEVLDSLHEMVTGNEQISNYFASRTEMLKESKANATLEEMIKKHQSAEAPSRSGLGDNASEMADTLRRWARGEFSAGKPRARVEFEDAQLRTTLQKHFGTKADSIFRALDREMEVERRESGVKKSQFDSDEVLSEEGDGNSDDREVESAYLDAKGRRSASPELYTRPDKDVGKSGFAPKSQQALLRFKGQHPGARVYFVSLKDYGKARGMSENLIAEMANGADPADVGYFKTEEIKGDDSLRDHEVRRMRMDDKFVKNKQGEVNPAAIMVPGTTTAYDSRRIANVMHKRANGEWSDLENANGMRGRMAQKFSEGIAELTIMHGKPLLVRDDQVIAEVDGLSFTWGEAQALLKRPDTVKTPDYMKGASNAEVKRLEMVTDLSDQELKTLEAKATDLRDALEAPLIAQVRLEVDREMGFAAEGSRKYTQKGREFKKRLAEVTKDEATKLPMIGRMLSAVENAMEQRAGEDRRTRVMDTGMETRQGINVSKPRRSMDNYASNSASQIGNGSGSDTSVSDLIDAFINSVYGGVKAGEGRSRAAVSDVDANDTKPGFRFPRGYATRASEASRRGVPIDQLDSDMGLYYDPTSGVAISEQKKQHGQSASGSLGSGRTKGDADGQIHDAAATVNANDLARNTQYGREIPDARLVQQKVYEVRRSTSPMKEGLANRLDTLARNMGMMSKADQNALRSAMSLSSLVDLKDAIEPIARKYADRIVPPGEKAQSIVGPSKKSQPETYEPSAAELMKEYRDYVDNPPENFEPERVQEIAKWARTKEAEMTAQGKTMDELSEEYDLLDDLRFGMRMLAEKAEQVASSDADARAADPALFGSTPNPKAVAAKKAAFLEKVASGDQALIDELRNSNDAKGLQRAAAALDGKPSAALDAINERLGELVQNPDVAYGLQTRKYSLDRSGFETTAGLLSWTRGGFIERPIGPLKRAQISVSKEFDGSIELRVLDRTREVGKDPVLTLELYENPEGKWEIGVDGPQAEHDTFQSLKEFFDYTTSPDPYGSGAEFSYSKYHDGVWSKSDMRKLFRTLRDAAAELGVDPDEVTFGRDTGVSAGKDYVTLSREQIKKFSALDATAATGKPLTDKGRKLILDYLNEVTPWVQAQFPFLQHAGEFTKEFGQAIVRVSAHALNPMSVAHHESLHAFFDHLRSNSAADVANVVTQTASKPAVTARLRELLAHSPEAQAQLADAEERAAYMYQFWAAGDEKLIAAMGDKPTTLFGKIAAALRKVLGMWTNDERALHILEYFNSGEYGKRSGRVGDAYQAMMDKGRNRAVEQVRGMGGDLMEIGEAVFGAGSANMRDSGIPALGRLADIMKRRGTDEGRDAGFIPAARLARAKYMQQLADNMGSFDEADLHEAQEALQHGTVASTAEARQVQQAVRKVLDDLYLYLGKSGVQVGDLGVGKDYYPRRWDVNYLSKNKDAFMAMARKYPDWHDPEATYNGILNNDGSELQVVDRPGMSSKQTRHLSFIDAADAAPFMSKNLLETVNSYVTQATRRAEWSRRLGDGNKRLEELYEQAKEEGATDKQIEQAKKFVAGVNGTLGDDLNPTARRYMGNMIVYQNIRLLPMAIFSSIVDPMGIAVRGGKIGDAWSTFKRGIREIPAGLKGEEVNDYYTQVAETMGVVDNAMMHAALGATYTQGVVSDTGKKINDLFFKYNLMEQFGRSMRVGATEAALKFLQQHSTKPSTHSERWLAELGLTAKDVRVVDGRVALTEADGLSAAHAARMRSAVNRWVDGAVLRPDAADKPVWMNDPRFMLISHLKQFVYSFQHTVLSRVVHEYRHGNMAPALALTSYVPIMLVADTVKGLVQGGGEEPEWKKGWTASDYLSNAVERAGMFGVGQFALDTAQGQWGSLTGPTLEQFVDGAGVLGGAKQFKPFALHSLPANSLYSNMVRGAGKEDVLYPE